MRVADREWVLRANVENVFNKSYRLANGSGGAGLNSPRIFILSQPWTSDHPWVAEDPGSGRFRR